MTETRPTEERGDGPLERPVVELRLVFADDTQESRFWRMGDGAPQEFDQPEWMREPRKSWPHPQDPIIFSALVEPGAEDQAREWLAEQGGSVA